MRYKTQDTDVIEIHWAARNRFGVYKKRFFDAVNNGYRYDEVRELKDHGIDDNSIFLCHLLGLYKASIEMGLVK